MSEYVEVLTLLTQVAAIIGDIVLPCLVVLSVDEMEIVLGLFISVFSIGLGTILIIVFVQKLWGIGAFKIVKPRPVLIYEGRPWWMKSVAALVFVAFSFTLLVEGTLWLFFPYAIPATMGMIEAFWLVILIACACVTLADRKKGNSLQETQDAASGNKE